MHDMCSLVSGVKFLCSCEKTFTTTFLRCHHCTPRTFPEAHSNLHKHISSRTTLSHEISHVLWFVHSLTKPQVRPLTYYI